MIIDAHSHYIPKVIADNTTFFKAAWSDENAQLKAMDELGVEKAVLLYPTSDAHIKMGGWGRACRIYNEEIAKFHDKFKGRFIAAGILPFGDEKGMLAELENIRALGLEALSLASSYDGRFLDDEIFFGLYERLQEDPIPIFVHSQIINPIGFERVCDPLLMPVLEYIFDMTMCMGKLMMSQIFSRHSRIKFIFAHFAGVAPFAKDRFDTTYTMLRSRNFVKDLGAMPSDIFKNIYVDTSGISSEAIFKCGLDTFDVNNIFWGSDYPANRKIKESIDVVNRLKLSDKEKSDILGNNLGRLFE